MKILPNCKLCNTNSHYKQHGVGIIIFQYCKNIHYNSGERFTLLIENKEISEYIIFKSFEFQLRSNKMNNLTEISLNSQKYKLPFYLDLNLVPYGKENVIKFIKRLIKNINYS